VLDFKQLLSNPEKTLGEFYTHIGIQYSPSSNEVKMSHSLNRGGKLRGVKQFMFGVGKYSRKLIIPFLPNKIRLALRYKLVELQVEAYSPNYKANDLSPTLLDRLDKHFKSDQMKAAKCGINLVFLNMAPEN
jgi:hypothetical protein